MFKHATVLLTAIVPTIGHERLITFAANMAETVDVIISCRSFEPTTFEERSVALRSSLIGLSGGMSEYAVRFVPHIDDSAPQLPKTDSEWKYWTDLISSNSDCIVASESYGKKLAELKGLEFIPYDISRDITNTKGTSVRNDLFNRYKEITSGFRKNISTSVTIFGADSTGKSTITKRLGEIYGQNTYICHEFARPYLENMDDKAVNEKKMSVILQGQFALQYTTRGFLDRPLAIFDTDTLTTLGYYKIFDIEPDQQFLEEIENGNVKKYLKSDLYIVMNDGIPFEENVLRYGGSQRESSRDFWVDLLKSHNCNFHLMETTDKNEQLKEAVSVIDSFIAEKHNKFQFERE